MKALYIVVSILTGVFLDLIVGASLGLTATIPFFSVLAFLVGKGNFWAAILFGLFWDSLSVMPFGTYLAAFFLIGGVGGYIGGGISARDPLLKTALALFLFLLFFAVSPLAGLVLSLAKGTEAVWFKSIDAGFLKTFFFQFSIFAAPALVAAFLLSRRKRPSYV